MQDFQAHPGGPDPARAEGRWGKGTWVALAACLLLTGILQGFGLAQMIRVGPGDFALATHAISAECFRRYGFLELRGAPLWHYPDGPALDENSAYVRRPAWIQWWMGANFRLFGPREWAARLPGVISALCTTGVLFFLLGGGCRPWPAAFGILAMTASPGYLAYTGDVNPVVPALPGLLLALLALKKMGDASHPRRWEWLCGIGFAMSVAFDWLALLALGIVAVLRCLGSRIPTAADRMRTALRLGSPSAVLLALHLLHVLWIHGSVGVFLGSFWPRVMGDAGEWESADYSWRGWFSLLPSHLSSLLGWTGIAILSFVFLWGVLRRRVRKGLENPFLILAAAQIGYVVLLRNYTIQHPVNFYYSLPVLAGAACWAFDRSVRSLSWSSQGWRRLWRYIWDDAAEPWTPKWNLSMIPRWLTYAVVALCLLHIGVGFPRGWKAAVDQEWAPGLAGRVLGELTEEGDRIVSHLVPVPTIRYYAGVPTRVVLDLEDLREAMEDPRNRYYLSMPGRENRAALEIHDWLSRHRPLVFGATYLFIFQLHEGQVRYPVVSPGPQPWWWRYLGHPSRPPYRIEARSVSTADEGGKGVRSPLDLPKRDPWDADSRLQSQGKDSSCHAKPGQCLPEILSGSTALPAV